MNEEELLLTIKNYLSNQKLSYTQIPNSPAFDFELPGKRVIFNCYIAVDAQSSMVVFYNYFPFTISPDARTVVSEFITLANFELVLGNFEMDMSDGEIRFRQGASFVNMHLTMELIHNLIIPSTARMERYIPGIVNVAKGVDKPADALKKVKGL